MALDSASYFAKRLEDSGLKDLVGPMADKGWDTLANFAFCVSLAPGPQDGEVFMEKVVVPLVGENSKLTMPLRRMYMEAYASVGTDLQKRAERTGDDPKAMPLPAVERLVRIKALAATIQGVSIKGPHEPSISLCGRYHTMFETGDIRFVPWELLTRRDAEVRSEPNEDLDGFKKDKKTGFLKVEIQEFCEKDRKSVG